MGDAFIATAPICPIHKGQMKWIRPSREIGGGFRAFDADYWICHGFDGEGCGHRIEGSDLDWHPMDEVEFNWTWEPGQMTIIKNWRVLP